MEKTLRLHSEKNLVYENITNDEIGLLILLENNKYISQNVEIVNKRRTGDYLIVELNITIDNDTHKGVIKLGNKKIQFTSKELKLMYNEQTKKLKIKYHDKEYECQYFGREFFKLGVNDNLIEYSEYYDFPKEEDGCYYQAFGLALFISHGIKKYVKIEQILSQMV